MNPKTEEKAMPHHALFYEVVPDYLERRGQYRDEHLGKAPPKKSQASLFDE